MTWFNELLTDLRYGVNRLRREPGFTLAVLMAAYESSAMGGGFVELQPNLAAREFDPEGLAA